MADPPDLRASDAERERAVARLRRAAAEDRLTVEELDRVAVDFEAGTDGGTRLVVSGRAPRRVRRAFAQLGA